MQDIDRRIELLERQNRWFKRGFLLLAVCVIGQFLLGAGKKPNNPAAAAAGAQVFDIVYAKTIVVGEPAKQRIHMTTQPDGSFLIMYDEAGVQRFRIAAKKLGAYSQMYNAKGKLIKKK